MSMVMSQRMAFMSLCYKEDKFVELNDNYLISMIWEQNSNRGVVVLDQILSDSEKKGKKQI